MSPKLKAEYPVLMSLRFSRNHEARLKRVAAVKGVSVSDVVRKAVDRYLDEVEKKPFGELVGNGSQ